MENVHEPNQGRIVSISQSIAGEIGQLLRQRSIGPEHAKKVDIHSDHPLRLFDAFKARRSKSQGWNLAETEKIFLQPNRGSDTWPIRVLCLQSSNSLEEIERVRPQGHFGS